MSLRKIWLSFKTPVTLLVLLVFVGITTAWAYKAVTTPIPKAPPKACVLTDVGPNFTADQVWMRILNGTKTGGLAKNVVKLQFGDAGFHVFVVKNADQKYDKTFVTGFSKDDPEVRLLMSYLPQGTPFVADPTMVDHSVDLTLGADFSADKVGQNAIKAIPLNGAQACVPTQYKNTSDS